MKKVHSGLKAAVNYISENKQRYVKKPTADFTRNRKLTFEDTIYLILSMEGGSLQKELYDFSEQKNIKITSSAFVQQRSKISSQAFKDLFHRFNSNCQDKRKYKGYRILAVDGSDINHFRNPNTDSFVSNSLYPHGYNQTHLNTIYDVCNNTYYDALLQPKMKFNEQGALIEMLQRNTFTGKNIIITDRGYEGYNMLAHLLSTQNIDCICRAKNGEGGYREVMNLEMRELDVDVSIEVTTTQTKEDKRLKRRRIPTAKKQGKIYKSKTRAWDFPSPYTLKFRIVRFQLKTGEYETIITSLSRDEFKINDIKELYHMRWGVETSFRHLKYAIGVANIHAKKEDLVYQDIYAALIMYNYCSRMANHRTGKKRQGAKHEYKINFKMAVNICRSSFKSLRIDFKKLIHDINEYLEPIRYGRHDKRNIKAKRFAGFAYRIAA